MGKKGELPDRLSWGSFIGGSGALLWRFFSAGLVPSYGHWVHVLQPIGSCFPLPLPPPKRALRTHPSYVQVSKSLLV